LPLNPNLAIGKIKLPFSTSLLKLEKLFTPLNLSKILTEESENIPKRNLNSPMKTLLKKQFIPLLRIFKKMVKH